MTVLIIVSHGPPQPDLPPDRWLEADSIVRPRFASPLPRSLSVSGATPKPRRAPYTGRPKEGVDLAAGYTRMGRRNFAMNRAAEGALLVQATACRWCARRGLRSIRAAG